MVPFPDFALAEPINDAVLVAFATGAAVGLLLGHVFLRLPLILLGMTVFLAIAVVGIWLGEGIPALTDGFRYLVAWVMANFPFVKGLTAGKLAAALLHISSRRIRR